MINGVPAAMGRAETPVTQGALLPLHPCLPGRRERTDLMHIYAGREMVLCCLPSQKINFTQVPCISLNELGKLWGRKAHAHTHTHAHTRTRTRTRARTHTHTHTHTCVHMPSYENPKTLCTSHVSRDSHDNDDPEDTGDIKAWSSFEAIWKLIPF